MAGFFLSVATAITLATFVYWFIERESQASAWVDHTQQVLDTLGQVKQAETSLDSLILSQATTGEEADTSAIDDHSGRIRGALQSLRDLTADNSAQQERGVGLAAAMQPSCRMVGLTRLPSLM